jgi:two-component system chemotaxis sensor kinase CheA
MMSQLSQTEVEESQRQGTQSTISEDSGLKPNVRETIRVGIDRLDDAIRLVGEIAVSQRKTEHRLLVLKELQQVAQNHIKHLYQMVQGDHASELMQEGLHILKGIESTFKENRDEIAMMEIVVAELYEDVLSMRMLPLSTVFDTFPRAVRDMAQYFQKKIALYIAGADTILDKKIIEQLDTPLIHILRNCVDHGIESPQERIEQGKPVSGMLSINAYQRSGHITIEISDDGRGIQFETLKQQAIQREMLSEETARALDKGELVNLVFLPRISTSSRVTDISGRGMGMDIVKANIEQLKGSVSLHSEAGKGTTCVLTLPMTLTTLRSLIISSRKKRFAVPIHSVVKTLQVASHDIIQMPGYNAIRLRDQIMYLVDLADLLGLAKEPFDVYDHHFVLLVQAEEKRLGLIVDEILDEQDLVVKQLPAHMQRVKIISGGTISKDNTVMLILHIPEVIESVQHSCDNFAEHWMYRHIQDSVSNP